MTDHRTPKFDFDATKEEYRLNWRETYKKMHAQCPVAYSDAHPEYGGTWVISDYDTVHMMSTDDETFEQRHDFPNGSTTFTGMALPPFEHRFIPMDIGYPEFKDYRRAIRQRFNLSTVRDQDARFRQIVNWCMDQHVEAGRMDVINDVAMKLVGLVIIELVGLPMEGWEDVCHAYHNAVAYTPGTPDGDKAYATIMRVSQQLREEFEDRKLNPRDDLLTDLAHAQIDGKPIDVDEAVDTCSLVLSGGSETTATLIAWSISWLAEHPEERHRLIGDDVLLDKACDEFLRWNPPNHVLCRNVTKDIEVNGIQFREGDRVQLSWAGANYDEKVFERPDEVIIDRFPNRHASFGFGGHRCLGLHHARGEFRAMMSEFLRRIPDYTVTSAVRYPKIDLSNGFFNMEIEFPPTPSENTPNPFEEATIA